MEYTRSQAEELDKRDVLAPFRDRFLIPKTPSGKESIYFCGNSLGLQSKSIRTAVNQELDDWAVFGVKGHHAAQHPWYAYHEFLTESMAEVIGAKPSETVVMNTLTVNLHLMMVSFYRPQANRYKILIEHSAFPSDRYAVESQIRFHGMDPEDALIVLSPPEGSDYISFGQVEEVFKKEGSQIALVLIGSVNYYTGQAYPIKSLTRLAHECGATIGFDLAHGAGNLLLNLHDDGPDFAVWCGYKYLNGGPGTLAGCFVHHRHANNKELPRFAGWWGHNKQQRFKMEPHMDLMPGAEGWQLSNPPILPMSCLRESLQIFQEAGMKQLREKSLAMGRLCFQLMDQLNHENIQIISPRNDDERGCQISIKMKSGDRKLFDRISAEGIIADWREPDVIRIAPVPLYNRFTEIYDFVQILKKALHE